MFLKFNDSSITQILREINFGESRRSNTSIFTIFGALNFVDLVNLRLQKVQKFIKNQNSKTIDVLKWQNLHF